MVALDLAGYFAGLRVENVNLLSSAVGDESLAEISHDDDAVASLEARNRAHDFIVIRIHHLNLGAMREVDSARRGIEGNVVKILRAARSRAQRNFLKQLITTRRRTCQGKHPENQKRCTHHSVDETASLHETSSCWLRDFVLPATPGRPRQPFFSATDYTPKQREWRRRRINDPLAQQRRKI